MCLQTHPTQLDISTPQHIFLPPLSESSPQNDININCSAAIISRNQPSPVSNPTTANQVDTDVKNDDDTNSFATPRKHNHITL